MKKNMKKFLTMILLLCVILSLFTACGRGDTPITQESATQEAINQGTLSEEEITIAYQPSVGYAPLIVMEELALIEKHYDGAIKVNWVEMNKGAEISEGVISGTIDVGSMGVQVAIPGIQAGGTYRIAFGLSAQPYALLTNSDRINSLRDITSSDQIALNNLNSPAHILLAMAAKTELGDAHALDGNLTTLSNPDGYTAMLTGAVTCHMVISPFNFMEVKSEDADIHEIDVIRNVIPAENTTLVSVISEKLKSEKPELYDAVLAAVEEAMAYIEENPEDVAEMLAKSYDASAEEILEWISDERSSYSTELHGVMDMAHFMSEEGFLDSCPDSINDLIYDNVKGD